MKNKTPDSLLKILLVEDHADYAHILQRRMSSVAKPSFSVVHADTLEKGLNCLAREIYDAVILDLMLPDSRGIQTFNRLHEEASSVPIVVLTAHDSETLGFETVRRGAQDYLIKDRTPTSELPRILGFAIERHKRQSELQQSFLQDELTGLYNRRGFALLAEQQIKLAVRSLKGSLFFYFDLDGLKKINDTFGHREGDQILIQAADLLRQTFRQTDILARLGGDEFGVLAIEAQPESKNLLFSRLQDALKAHHAKTKIHGRLSISSGAAFLDPAQPCALEELMSRADQAMYRQKRAKKQWAAQQLQGKELR